MLRRIESIKHPTKLAELCERAEAAPNPMWYLAEHEEEFAEALGEDGLAELEDALAERIDLPQYVEEAIEAGLSYREIRVLEERRGLRDRRPKTRSEIGRLFGTTPREIHGVERNALRRLCRSGSHHRRASAPRSVRRRGSRRTTAPTRAGPDDPDDPEPPGKRLVPSARRQTQGATA